MVIGDDGGDRHEMCGHTINTQLQVRNVLSTEGKGARGKNKG